MYTERMEWAKVAPKAGQYPGLFDKLAANIRIYTRFN
jgi:hypothetical protein